MNNDGELEGRPRPLSTGLWTLFSWLRREDRSDSSDSLSSAGSDRTVASFAFLRPAHYQPAKTPLVLPPPGPPTDSYKKRVHDRNLRRQYDRDLTLHRKYGLYKSGEITCGYDAFSLPPVRRTHAESGGRWDRERRATSECYHRRLAHVPGKRRAPLPPISTTPAATTSLTRRTTRKRRAPPPPIKIIDKNKENIKHLEGNSTVTQMKPHSFDERQKLRNNDVTMGCKSEKYSKKDGCTKDTKVKSEKNFLKQIFDSKKRNSGIDISSVKLLPSISELDKQAAEIIESCKLNPSEHNNNVKNMVQDQLQGQSSSALEVWICVSCLRRYNSSVVTCLYCVQQKVNSAHRGNQDVSTFTKASNSCTQTDNDLVKSVSTNKNAADEKQKLKEMLKEMKDSLPKRPKHDSNKKKEIKTVLDPEVRSTSSYSTETPTLRVGCTVQPSTSNNNVKQTLPETISTTPIKPTPTIQVASNCKQNNNDVIFKKKVEVESIRGNDKTRADVNPVTNIAKPIETTKIGVTEPYKYKKDLNTPLKISSLLNPMYIPKNLVSNKPISTEIVQTELNSVKPKSSYEKNKSASKVSPTTSNSSVLMDALAGPSTSEISPLNASCSNKIVNKLASGTENISEATKKKDVIADSKVEDSKIISELVTKGNILKDKQDQHSRRRDLIHKLEQSIAKGDEVAAAEAAAKLAQLRLSCSVLSFSSQILSPPSTSTSNIEVKVDKIISTKPTTNTPIKNVKTDPPVRLSSVKEKSPQKVTAINVRSSAALAKPDIRTTEVSKAEPVKSNKSTSETKKDDPITTISVLVEDREATRGPVHLRINRKALMRDLRREAEITLGLATHLQRWIVGRALCINDNTPVISLAGPDFSAPFYLCVVESEKQPEPAKNTVIDKPNDNKNTQQIKPGNVYTELVQLEQQALVPNADNFECGVCMEEYRPGSGVVLRECVHIFCKDCLADVVRHCEEPNIPCPAMGCKGMLQEREVRALVTPHDYERWLARGLAAAESGTRNAFHCRTRDCKGWALCEPGVRRFPCPVCKKINCVPCQAIHDGETCEQHQTKLKEAASAKNNASETDDGTRTLLNSLIAKGEALECPECSAIITKKWGCDWVKCSACKTEICWVTRGRRWGPGGKGDTSGGCRCGIDGKRCHPSCGYCH